MAAVPGGLAASLEVALIWRVASMMIAIYRNNPTTDGWNIHMYIKLR